LKNFVVDANTRMASIISWGDLAFTSFESMFKNVKRRTSAPALKPLSYDTPVSSGVTSMESMFSNSNIGVNPSDWDLSSCTSLRSAFANYRLSSVTSQVQAIDVSAWSVAPLTDVQYAFDSAITDSGITGVGSLNITGCTSLLRTFAGVSWAATEDFSGLDTSNVTSMNQVFSGCATFTGIGLETWDVSKVQNMAEAFKGATVFNGNISGWDTSSVTTMESLFNNAIAFNQNISTWDTSSVTSLNQTFFNAKAFNQALNLWDVSSVTNFYRTFYGATVFNAPLDLWLVSAATNMQGMFYNAIAFNQDITTWCVTNISVKPTDFDTGSAAWLLPVDESRPVWGGSPCVAGYYTPIYKPEQFSYTITGGSTKIESLTLRDRLPDPHKIVPKIKEVSFSDDDDEDRDDNYEWLATGFLVGRRHILTNYHVFYEMLAGLSDEQKQKYGLSDAQKYFY
jgi:surface protein